MYTNYIIENEIKINGNTNYITDSGLAKGSQIFAIGDSHTIFFYNSMKIKEHWGYGGKIPLTIFTLLRDNLNIYNIGTILGNGHEKYNIKENDFVIFYYGFNDIQKNIYLYSNNKWENEINILFKKYIQKIIEFKEIYKINIIVTCIYPNPRPEAIGLNAYGTLEERQTYCLLANKILKEECIKNNLLFLDIYDLITDNDGLIKKK